MLTPSPRLQSYVDGRQRLAEMRQPHAHLRTPRHVGRLGVHPAVQVDSVAAHGPCLEAVATGVRTLEGNIVILAQHIL